MVAQELLKFSDQGSFFVINGPMGAGKTTFTKSICTALGVTETVSSPTFSIVNEYSGVKGSVYHFDFYRIKSLSEAYDIGYEDYFYGNSICIVEWAEKIEALLPDKYTQVDIEIVNNHTRSFEFKNIA